MDRRLGSKEGALEVKSHEFFTGICWDRVLKRDYEPPFVPCLSSADDVSNFDTRFTSKSPRESDDLGSHRNNTQGKFFYLLGCVSASAQSLGITFFLFPPFIEE